MLYSIVGRNSCKTEEKAYLVEPVKPKTRTKNTLTSLAVTKFCEINYFDWGLKRQPS